MPGVLQTQETFPYDCLDEILAFAVDGGDLAGTRSKGGTRAALKYALICKYWHDRFRGADVMWGVILSESGLAHAASWRNPKWAKRAYVMAKELIPLASNQLTPLEDCSLDFQCPVYAEAMTYKGNKEFHCSGCNKSVFLVTSMAEKDQRAKEGHCVMMTLSGTPGLAAPSDGNGAYFPLTSDEDPEDLLKVAQREVGTEGGALPPPQKTLVSGGTGVPRGTGVRTTVRVAVVCEFQKELETTVRGFLRMIAAAAEIYFKTPADEDAKANPNKPKAKRSVSMFPTLTVEYGKMRYFFKAMLLSESWAYDNLNCDPLLKFGAMVHVNPDRPGPSNAFKETGPLYHHDQMGNLTGENFWSNIDKHFDPKPKSSRLHIPPRIVRGMPKRPKPTIPKPADTTRENL